VDCKFPSPVMDCLNSKGIKKPTPIQIQGLPVALAGRDMVGIAFTGSGKSLTFSLPLIMLALEEELRMSLIHGEGPVGIILAPSRELARQTYDLVHDFCVAISSAAGYPELRSQLLIGGESVRDQVQLVQTKGVHCVVATPGRLRDLLKRRSMNLLLCRYICLDEADRMLDMGFGACRLCRVRRLVCVDVVDRASRRRRRRRRRRGLCCSKGWSMQSSMLTHSRHRFYR
jgi:ATP-dependent RNA helicase DDX41